MRSIIEVWNGGSTSTPPIPGGHRDGERLASPPGAGSAVPYPGAGSAPVAGVEAPGVTPQPAAAVQLDHRHRRHPPPPGDLRSRERAVLQPDPHAIHRHVQPGRRLGHGQHRQPDRVVPDEALGRDPQRPAPGTTVAARGARFPASRVEIASWLSPLAAASCS